MTGTPCIGVDFSSRPNRRKPVVLARGERLGAAVRLNRIDTFPTLEAFGQWLAEPGPWVGAFDFPFGLPRELVEQLGWPLKWRELIEHYCRLNRTEIATTFQAFCNGRPVGSKFAHRACDGPAGSSPSMRWVNPPVAFMLHAGVPLLLAAGVHLPGLHAGDETRVAVEGYPGLLARELIARRSYKSDTLAQQTPQRLIARKDIIDALEQGRTRLGLRLRCSHAQRDALVADAQGDALDAVLCMMQAGWALDQPAYGLPNGADALEGWIVSA